MVESLYTTEDIKQMLLRTREVIARIKERANQFEGDEEPEAIAIAAEMDPNGYKGNNIIMTYKQQYFQNQRSCWHMG